MLSSPMVTNANAAKEQDRATKKMSRGGGWSITMGMGYHHHSSSSSSCKNRSQPAESKDNGEGSSSSKKKKKKGSISISRSMACAGSICSTKESSVFGRRRDGVGAASSASASASSRSLKAPDADAVSSAAVSASSSFNSEATVATTVTTTTTASGGSSSPPSPLSSSMGGSFRAAQMRKLSGCYECHSALDPRSLAVAAMLPCADCGELFAKPDSLELHRATMHAVSELGGEDTSRNIVEIIFQSSWLKKQGPVCKIERILKVQSSGKTVRRFEQYKESIKARASGGGGAEGRRNPRCVADGNELLRFHCTTFACSLGLAGATALCRAPSPECRLCSIIKDGFRVDDEGRITTMATSGRAHDKAQVSPDGGGERRAMLVCRVVAGRVKKGGDNGGASPEESDCDSISSCSEGVYSDLDELVVFNPRAILPCFIVIYSGY